MKQPRHKMHPNYEAVYPKMSDEAREAMEYLYSKGINHGDNTWVTYREVEKTVARIIKDVYKLW